MLLLHLQEVDEKRYAAQLKELLGNYRVVTNSDDFKPEDIRYIAVWKPKDNAFNGLSNLKAVLSLGAGVDALLAHPNLPSNTPIVRFVDRELTQCMSDYIISNVYMHQRAFTRYNADQNAKKWAQFYPPPAWEISVGIMGLGILGIDAATRLMGLGFNVRGWSHSPKSINDLTSFAGNAQFDDFLAGTDILVNLLPLTDETRGILNYKTFSKLRHDHLKDGPALVNAARGAHQIEEDIVKALGDGTLGAASLDVFNVEPLPTSSPLWELKNCYVTPHIAAISNPDTGAKYFAKVISDHENGQPLINVINPEIGY